MNEDGKISPDNESLVGAAQTNTTTAAATTSAADAQSVKGEGTHITIIMIKLPPSLIYFTLIQCTSSVQKYVQAFFSAPARVTRRSGEQTDRWGELTTLISLYAGEALNLYLDRGSKTVPSMHLNLTKNKGIFMKSTGIKSSL